MSVDAVLTPRLSAESRVIARWVAVAVAAAFPAALLLAVTLTDALNTALPSGGLTAFRVGSLAMTDEVKTADAAFPLVLFGTLTALVFLLARSLKKTPPDRFVTAFLLIQLLIASPLLVQTLFGIGRPVVEYINSPLLTTVIFQIPPALFFLASRILRARRGDHTPADTEKLLPLLVLSATLGLSSLGAVTAARFVVAPTIVPGQVAVALWIVVGVLLVAFALWLAVSPRITARLAVPAGFAGSALLTLPLLLPPLLVQGGVSIASPGTNSTMWKLTIAVLAVIIVAETVFRVTRRTPRSIWLSLSSLSVAVLLVPLRSAYFLATVPTDDYHFGEVFAPFALWREAGQLPYIDVFLPRGILLNVVPGFVNAALNNGSAATAAFGTTIIAVIAIAIAHALLRPAIGFAWATCAVALLAVSNAYIEGDLLAVAALIAILAFARRRPSAVLLGLVLVAANALSILAYPMMGLVSTAATIGVLVLAFVGALISRSRRDLRYGSTLAIVMIVFAVAVMLSPAGKMLTAAVGYVVANSGSNAEAFGIALRQLWMAPFGIGQFLSFAFILGIAVSVWLLWSRRKMFRFASWDRYLLLGIAAVPAGFVLVLTGRYLGRVDAGEWTFRPAAGSLVVLGVLIPAIIWLVAGKRYRVVGRYSLAVAAIISIALLPFDQGGLLKSSLGQLSAPASWPSAEYVGAAPQLGVGLGNDEQMSSVSELATVSEAFPPAESVLNLTNRGALFGYLDWRNPIPYLAAYNIESDQAEAGVIASLDRDKPLYALVGPGPQFDGLSLTLRNPHLSHWLTENYTPFQCGSFIWATRGVGAEASGPGLLTCPGASETAPATEEEIATLWATSIGAPVDLGIIPTSWGSRSAEFSTAKSVGVVTPAASSPAGLQNFTLDFSSPVNRATSLLDLTATCPANPSAPRASLKQDGATWATLSWATPPAAANTTTASETQFIWGSGKFIIPLDAYPTWSLSGQESTSLQFSVPLADCNTGWDVQATLVERP